MLSCTLYPQVIVRTWPNQNIPYQFFRIMDNEVPLTVGTCGHFYEQDEYEMVSVCWVEAVNHHCIAAWSGPS